MQDTSLRKIVIVNAGAAGHPFVDCSGFKALLISGTTKSPFENRSHRRLLLPFTTSTARAPASPCP